MADDGHSALGEARGRAVGVSQRGKATERLGKVKRAAARIILTAPDDWGRDTVGCAWRAHPAD